MAKRRIDKGNRLKNVQAILEELDYTDNDVVQAIAYCKTTEVEKLFTNGMLSWVLKKATTSTILNKLQELIKQRRPWLMPLMEYQVHIH